MHLDQKIQLRQLHTFHMEVIARYFVEARTPQDLLTLLNYRNMIFMPVLIMGGGSNLLFNGDFNGLVVHVNTRGIEIMEETAHDVTLRVQSGEPWDGFVEHCVSHGWAGVENLSLIPGTVGGAPVQNIGAYGCEVKEVIIQVNYVDIKTGKQHTLSNSECRFGYRDSIFKHELRGKTIITDVVFRLKKFRAGERTSTGSGTDDNPYILKLDYGDIRKELLSMGVEKPGPEHVRKAVITIRSRKLPDPAILGNAGSFFRNPSVKPARYEKLKAEFPAMPGFPSDDGQAVKIPAAWLIEQCGWKGFREGDAGVYPGQPLVLVNYGNATGGEIVSLAGKITRSVEDRFAIRLEPEVNILKT